MAAMRADQAEIRRRS